MEQTLILLFLGLYGLLIMLLYKIFTIEKKITAVRREVEYSPVITVWKFFKQLAFGGASFVLIDLATNFSAAIQEWKPIGIIFLIAFLNAINNYLKYR